MFESTAECPPFGRMHLAFSPAMLEEGEHLSSAINLHPLGFVPYKIGREKAEPMFR